jgi:hypothetical protein
MRMEMPMILAKYKLDDTKSVTWRTQDSPFFIFCWPCISLQILANNQLDALFHVFIYFISLRVPSIIVLIIRRSNCINTSSGMSSLCKWLLGMPAGHLTDFHEIRYLSMFRKYVEKIHFSLKSNKNGGHFSWRAAHIYKISLTFLEWDFFSEKFCR